jgi:hypothetical protein
MKTAPLFFSLLALVAASTAASAAPVFECKEAVLMESDDAGNLTPRPTGMSVTVYEDAAGQRGYVAKIRAGGQEATELDVAKISSGVEGLRDLEEMAALVFPSLDWTSVRGVEGFDVGVRANQQDAAGGKLFGLRGADGADLGTLMTYGWGFGYCAK